MSTAAANLMSFPAPESEPLKEPNPEGTFKPWQKTVIKLLVQGCSIAEAMRRVGLTEDAFYKARRRQSEFAEYVNAARQLHCAQVEDAFHCADAYARNLVDAIQREPNLPAGLRLRAALAILNRKTGAWLPQALPAFDVPLEILNTLDIPDTLDMSDAQEALDNMDKLDNLDNEAAHAGTESVFEVAEPGSATVHDETLSTPDDGSCGEDTPTPVTPDTLDTLDELAHLDPHAARETAEILDELAICFGSRALAEQFYALACRENARPDTTSPSRPSCPIR